MTVGLPLAGTKQQPSLQCRTLLGVPQTNAVKAIRHFSSFWHLSKTVVTGALSKALSRLANSVPDFPWIS